METKNKKRIMLLLFMVLLVAFTIGQVEYVKTYQLEEYEDTSFHQLADGVFLVDGKGELTQIAFLNGIHNAHIEISRIKHLIMGKSFTGICANCFAKCENLESIRIGDNVAYIQQYAFTGCNNLKEVFWPDSLHKVNSKAFYGCSQLLGYWGSSNVYDRAMELSPKYFVFCQPDDKAHYILSINMKKMAVYGNGENDDGVIILDSRGIMYGPYTTLLPAHYDVHIQGYGFENLTSEDFWCNVENELLNGVSEVRITPTDVFFSLNIAEECSNFEICCRNARNEVLTIESIKLSYPSMNEKVFDQYWLQYDTLIARGMDELFNIVIYV